MIATNVERKVTAILNKFDDEKNIHRDQMLDFIKSRVKKPDERDLLHVKAGFDSGWWSAVRFLHQKGLIK